MSILQRAFTEHKEVLIAYLSRFLLKSDDIDDILQTTFLKTLEASQERTIDSPKAYLFIVTRNLAFKKLKRNAKRIKQEIDNIDEQKLPDIQVSAESSLHHKLKIKSFAEAIAQLPAQCRRVFIMRKIQGMTHKEIATELNISTSTVERHISNAIQRCRDLMCDDGYNMQKPPISEIGVDKKNITNSKT